jgi:hypothetical protein
MYVYFLSDLFVFLTNPTLPIAQAICSQFEPQKKVNGDDDQDWLDVPLKEWDPGNFDLLMEDKDEDVL